MHQHKLKKGKGGHNAKLKKKRPRGREEEKMHQLKTEKMNRKKRIKMG